MNAQEQPELAIDKIYYIRQWLDTVEQSLDDESVSLGGLVDVNALYDVVNGKLYD